MQRYNKEKEVSLRTLLLYWNLTFEECFSEESLDRILQKFEDKLEILRKQGEKAGAWSSFSADVRYRNEMKDYHEANKLPDGEREKRINELKNRPNYLVIG